MPRKRTRTAAQVAAQLSAAQAAYTERQRAMGRRARSYRLTDEEAQAVQAFIKQYRGRSEK